MDKVLVGDRAIVVWSGVLGFAIPLKSLDLLALLADAGWFISYACQSFINRSAPLRAIGQ